MDVKIMLKIHSQQSEYIPSGFSVPTASLFKSIENKHDIYKGKDYTKKLCESLWDHLMEIINFRKK